MAFALLEMKNVFESVKTDMASIGYNRWPPCVLHGGCAYGPAFITAHHLGQFVRQLTGPAHEEVVRLCSLAQLSASDHSEVRCMTAVANEVYLETERPTQEIEQEIVNRKELEKGTRLA
eukprot:gene32024-40464_t